ncbi:hypothetical protein [Ruminiclostridium hungatei]|nr:hypothetical protein [Ruminiclostridium hungatei]
MLKPVKNQKGSVMLAVVVVLAILVILGVALLDSSTMGYKISKHEETADKAYYAAQTGIERCFSHIVDYCANESNTNGMNGADEVAFARQVIENIKASLETEPGKIIYKIDLSGGTGDTATVTISDIRYIKHQPSEDHDPRKIDVTVGVTAESDYERFGDRVSNKKISSFLKVTMHVPKDFQLNAAIYTIGDLMVENINAQVKGDVVAFGTSPQYAKQVQQYYYGGIYAKDGGHLSVDGNAYSRGLIRTGEYLNMNSLAPSSIYIYRDAIANGIQVFGTKERIVVGRNAYTFDDLEMNGEDSVIAINGSYLGLTNEKDAKAHDQSSAIVNSAIIHYAGSEDSMKSRIVINGDVIINGGTFNVDSDGNPTNLLEQIEDASVLVSGSLGTPMYKEYLDEINNGVIDPRVSPYHSWLYGKKSLATGFVNLFQRWMQRAFIDDNDIDLWMQQIDLARGSGTNDSTCFDINTPAISGFCHYEIGANDRIYFMNRSRYNASDMEVEILPLSFVTTGPGLAIDYVTEPASSWPNYMKDGLPQISSDWKGQDLDDDRMSEKLKEILNMVRPLTQPFAKRDFDGTNTFILNSNQPSTEASSANLFLSVRDKLEDRFGTGTKPHVINLSTVTPGAVDINAQMNERISSSTPGAISTDDYYLFINSNPKVTLEVSGRVNGIVFSMGKVILKKDAEVTGAVIAAGRGYTPDSAYGYLSPDKSSADQQTVAGVTTNYLPQILKEGQNLQRLDDGSYAGVHFAGSGVADLARVTFPGRYNLLTEFLNEGIDLDSIF